MKDVRTMAQGISGSLVFLLVSMSNALAEAPALQSRENILSAVAALHEIDEKQAVDRLAAESIASDIDRVVRDANIFSYAGSWFDASSGRLKVAVAEEGDTRMVAKLGAEPVLVQWSLTELESLRDHVSTGLPEVQHSSIRKSYVDYRTNRLVLEVVPAEIDELYMMLSDVADRVEIAPSMHEVDFSSGPVRGANGTRNVTWEAQFPPPPDERVCSIGVSVNDGFLTAGHCGWVGNEIRTPGLVLLGVVQNSTDGLPSMQARLTSRRATTGPRRRGVRRGSPSVPQRICIGWIQRVHHRGSLSDNGIR